MFALILFPFAAPVAPGPKDGRTLEEAVAAHGGLERFRAVRDWRIVADRKLEGDSVVNETYEEYLLRDGSSEKTLLVKKRRGSVLVFGHDGNTGFALTDGRLRDDEGAPGEGYYRAHGEYYLRALPFKWLDPGVRAEYAGRETAEGRELDLLRITAGENVGKAWKDVWVAAIDRETHLLWEARLTHHRENETWMDPPATGTTGSLITTPCRDISGLRIPHRSITTPGLNRSENGQSEHLRSIPGLAATAIFSPEAHRTR
jgi:hypothetical protein